MQLVKKELEGPDSVLAQLGVSPLLGHHEAMEARPDEAGNQVAINAGDC